jgi:hypothetical protein
MKKWLIVCALAWPLSARGQATSAACPKGIFFEFQVDVQARFVT